VLATSLCYSTFVYNPFLLEGQPGGITYGPLVSGTKSNYCGKYNYTGNGGKSTVYPVSASAIVAFHGSSMPDVVKEGASFMQSLFAASPSSVSHYRAWDNMIKPKRCLFTEQQLYKAVSPFLHHLKMPKFSVGPTEGDIAYVEINPEASAGIWFKQEARKRGFSSSKYGLGKGGFASGILSTSQFTWRLIEEGVLWDWGVPAEQGGRAKVTTFDHATDNIKDIKTRIVCVADATFIAVVSNVSQFWLREAGEDFRRKSVLWIGQSMTHNQWIRLYQFEGCDLMFEADGSQFDESLTESVVGCAIRIWSDSFPKSRRMKRIFRFIKNSHKKWHFLDPRGHCYRVNGGMNSGSGDTTIVNSLCNFIIWTSIANLCPEFKGLDWDAVEMAYMGDDVVLGFKGENAKIWRGADWEKVREWADNELNYKFSGEKFGKWNPNKDEDAVHFLGVSIVRGSISFDIIRWVKKFLCAVATAERKKKQGSVELFAEKIYGIGVSELRKYKWDIGGMAILPGRESGIAAELIALGDLIMEKSPTFDRDWYEKLYFLGHCGLVTEETSMIHKILEYFEITEKEFGDRVAIARGRIETAYKTIYCTSSTSSRAEAPHWEVTSKETLKDIIEKDVGVLPNVFQASYEEYLRVNGVIG